MILKTPYCQSWEANDYLNHTIYSIGHPTNGTMQMECNYLFNKYRGLNRSREFLQPENCRREFKEEHSALKELLSELSTSEFNIND